MADTPSIPHVGIGRALASSSNRNLPAGAGDHAPISIPLVSYSALAVHIDSAPNLTSPTSLTRKSIPKLTARAAHASSSVPILIIRTYATSGQGIPNSVASALYTLSA